MLLTKKFGPIPIARLVMTAVLILFAITDLLAGEISVYKDQDGVINLTNRPAPEGVRVQHVIRYEEKSAADLEQAQALDEQKRRDADREKDARKTRELTEKATRATAEAEEERVQAREKTEEAEQYLERYKQKRRSQRRRHRKTAQQVTQEAQEAQDRANAAITRANQAREEAREAIAGQAGKTE